MSMGKAGLLKNKVSRLILGLLLLILALGFFCKRKQSVHPIKNATTPEEGVVAVVYDGDTIKIEFDKKNSRKIRLIGIDAPEIGQTEEEELFQAQISKRFTFSHLYRERVKLTFDRELEDKYGRLLAYVWTEKQGLFNKFILNEGFAAAYLHFPFREDYRQDFEKAEKEARRLEKGLWGGPDYAEIPASEAGNHLGQVVSVIFFCAKLQPDEKFVFLHSRGDVFTALIPKGFISAFSNPEIFEHQNISVTGFLEEYKGQPQIFLFVPSQIKIVTPK